MPRARRPPDPAPAAGRGWTPCCVVFSISKDTVMYEHDGDFSWRICWPEPGGFPPNVLGPHRKPCFLVEFGNPQDDAGGFMVTGFEGNAREFDDLPNPFTPAVLAGMLARLPLILIVCIDLVYQVKESGDTNIPSYITHACAQLLHELRVAGVMEP